MVTTLVARSCPYWCLKRVKEENVRWRVEEEEEVEERRKNKTATKKRETSGCVNADAACLSFGSLAANPNHYPYSPIIGRQRDQVCAKHGVRPTERRAH